MNRLVIKLLCLLVTTTAMAQVNVTGTVIDTLAYMFYLNINCVSYNSIMTIVYVFC